MPLTPTSTYDEAMAGIRRGWSCHTAVVLWASKVRAALAAGDAAEAERLAGEIDRMQAAEHNRTAAPGFRLDPDAGSWSLPLDWWAGEIFTASRFGRHFGREGMSKLQAVAEAQRLFRRLSVEDSWRVEPRVKPACRGIAA